MPIVKNFSFTLKTDADTFCTWLEDRSAMWVYSYITDKGLVVEFQKTRLSKRNSRTICSFDAVIEIADEEALSEDRLNAEKRLFKEFVYRKGLLCKGVFSIMVSPAPLAGQIDIRALCMNERTLGGFSYVLTKIAEAYPEAEAKIREQEDQRVVSGSPDSDQSYVLRGTRKRGRPRVFGYDDAYQNILDGMDMETAFDKYMSAVENVMPDDWNNFRRAMNRRKEKGET